MTAAAVAAAAMLAGAGLCAAVAFIPRAGRSLPKPSLAVVIVAAAADAAAITATAAAGASPAVAPIAAAAGIVTATELIDAQIPHQVSLLTLAAVLTAAAVTSPAAAAAATAAAAAALVLAAAAGRRPLGGLTRREQRRSARGLDPRVGGGDGAWFAAVLAAAAAAGADTGTTGTLTRWLYPGVASSPAMSALATAAAVVTLTGLFGLASRVVPALRTGPANVPFRSAAVRAGPAAAAAAVVICCLQT